MVQSVVIPEGSVISRYLKGADFSDAFEVQTVDTYDTAMDVYLSLVSETPQWVDFLMSLRNRLASLIGLKNLGSLGSIEPEKSSDQYRAGDRVGIFSVLSLSDNEVVLIDSDKHLDVKVSVRKVESQCGSVIVVSTVVHTHNLLGRAYMLPVGPIHKYVVPAVLKPLDSSVGYT